MRAIDGRRGTNRGGERSCNGRIHGIIGDLTELVLQAHHRIGERDARAAGGLAIGGHRGGPRRSLFCRERTEIGRSARGRVVHQGLVKVHPETVVQVPAAGTDDLRGVDSGGEYERGEQGGQ